MSTIQALEVHLTISLPSIRRYQVKKQVKIRITDNVSDLCHSDTHRSGVNIFPGPVCKPSIEKKEDALDHELDIAVREIDSITVTLPFETCHQNRR